MKKNLIRVSALSLVLLILVISLVSCGGLSGTYEASVAGNGVSYTFKGSKVTVKATVLGVVASFEGKYKIADNEITFTFEDEDAKQYAGTQTFEKGDGFIKIGLVEYKKK